MISVALLILVDHEVQVSFEVVKEDEQLCRTPYIKRTAMPMSNSKEYPPGHCHGTANCWTWL
jgi:hypothetical protein